MKKINVVLLLMILSLSLFISPAALLAEKGEGIVATVNGVAIDASDFYEILETQYGPYVLNDLIQNEIIKQRSEILGVTFNPEEFVDMYSMILAQLGGTQGLDMFLMQNNISEEQFIQQLQWNMLISSMASAEVQVEEGAIEAFFAENSAYYDEPETVEVSHILVAAETEAREILAELLAGGDLLSLAQKHSLDPGTAQKGGYLGLVPRGYTVKEFEEMAFGLDIGAYDITESQFGWHIITVHAKNEAKEAVFEEIAELVEQDYRQSRALDLESYMYKLEQEADIQIKWNPAN